ncbi:ABC transporter substrate-binding protein [uncultured Aquitalea sp.]|uniref:substrate-binding periplasmic protein n=1 Tax=uncultured Aquitalea sp. TaxID=540272 RepID=UPI0025CBFFB5|nr:ABC transporter substrate-binding protein [uncultured Aquitalea sp.]
MVGRRILAVLLLAASTVQAGVTACGGDNQWPPSSYRLPAAPEQVVGYSPDVLKAALPAPWKPDFRLMPFARCLSSAAQGEGVQIVMGASKTPEREKQFLFSQSYLRLNPVAASLRRPPSANRAVREWCGIHGFNYKAFGLTDAQVDSGSANYADLMRKLEAGHCRQFVEYREVLLGLGKLGVLDPVGQLVYRPLPGAKPVDAYFMISRRAPQAERLLAQLNVGLSRLEARGELKRLLAERLQNQR